MSLAGATRLQWGDEDVAFDLGVGEWRRIQDRCDAGPGEIYRRLIGVATAIERGLTLGQAAAAGFMGDWRIDDVREVLIQGQIGAGAAELDAVARVRRLFDDGKAFRANLALAFAIVKHGLRDFEDAPPGERTGEAESRTSPEESSGSDGSTSTA